MMKIAVLGLIIAGITISIFMTGSGPCDPFTVPKPPPFASARGEGIGTPETAKGGMNWGDKVRCKLESLGLSKNTTQSTSSASLAPSAESKDSAPSSNLSVVFKFNSRDESRTTELKLESLAYKDHPVKKFSPYLPIKVDLETKGKIVWQATVTAPDCRDDVDIPYCGVRGYVNNAAWWKSGLKLRAYDVNGKRVAYLDYQIQGKKK